MIIYLINIVLLILYKVIFLHESSQRNNKIFCILASINWILLSGLRHLTIGADTIKYGYIFEQAQNISWSTLWNERVNIFIHGSMGKDPGYIVFQKLFQLLSTDYRIYLILIAVIFTVPLGIWIYRYSHDPFMSFLIYSSLFYSFFSITGIRQTIATAIVVFVGYEFIKERNIWKFILLVLIASTIHLSAMCFLPFYFITNKKLTNKYLVLYGCTFAGILALKDSLFRLGSRIIGYDQYQPYEGAATWTFSIFLIALTIVTLMKRKEILTNNTQAIQYMNALLIAVLLVPFTFINPSAMRIIQYFSLFIILLVPELINSFPKKERFFVFFVASATLIFLLIRNNPAYMFFWQ